MKILYVAFFGDGPKWDNFVLTLAPPNGVSNYRPFRYGDNRVAQDVLTEIGTGAGQIKLSQEPAVLAARFGALPDSPEGSEWQLLPLRKVEIVKIDYLPGNHSVYFRAGALFDFREIEDIRDCLVVIPAGERTVLGKEAIFFRSDVQPQGVPVAPEDERASWTKLCSLLTAANSPVRAEAKKATYVRPQAPRSGNHVAAVAEVFDSSVEGKRYGWKLRESLAYEQAWDHRIPSLIGSTTSVSGLVFEAHTETESIELANAKAPISSNYEQHALGLTARSPSGTFESVALVPSASEVSDSTGDAIYASEVRFPVAVRKNLWYRFKRSLAATGALVIVVTVALLGQEIDQKGWRALWPDGLASFLTASIPIVALKIIEEKFRQ
jgi:hypothetical protein